MLDLEFTQKIEELNILYEKNTIILPYKQFLLCRDTHELLKNIDTVEQIHLQEVEEDLVPSKELIPFCAKIKSLSLANNNLTRIPLALKFFTGLESLDLSNNFFTLSLNLDILQETPLLKTLNLSASFNEEEEGCFRFPYLLCLEDLKLSFNSGIVFEILPIRFVSLRKLYLERNQLHTVSLLLEQDEFIQQLDLLVVDALIFKDYKASLLKLSACKQIQVYNRRQTDKYFIRQVQTLLNAFYKQGAKTTTQTALWKMLYGKKKLSNLSLQQLCYCLKVGNASLQYKALEVLEAYFRAQDPRLKAGDCIYINGYIGIRHKTLKKRLMALGVKLVKSKQEDVQHIVLGLNPAMTNFSGKTVYWTEQMLIQALDAKQPPFLLQEPMSLEYKEHIAKLLQSRQEDSVLLALELLQSGGVPEPLFTALFLVYKDHSQRNIKMQSFSLLSQYASKGMLLSLKRRLEITNPFMLESDLRRNLEYYVEEAELNPYTLANYLYIHYKIGSNFALANLRGEERKAYIEMLIGQGGDLDLQELELVQLGDDLAMYKNIKRLNISYNRFKTLPSVLLQMSSLEELNLEGCYRMKNIPRALFKLPKLKRVCIDYTNLKCPQAFLAKNQLCKI